jgi:hypothetical protein
MSNGLIRRVVSKVFLRSARIRLSEISTRNFERGQRLPERCRGSKDSLTFPVCINYDVDLVCARVSCVEA